VRHNFRVADVLTVLELLAGEVENLCSFEEVPVVMLDLLFALEDRSELGSPPRYSRTTRLVTSHWPRDGLSPFHSEGSALVALVQFASKALTNCSRLISELFDCSPSMSANLHRRSDIAPAHRPRSVAMRSGRPVFFSARLVP
jgi:hypothetical protein